MARITVDVIRFDGKKIETITRACRFQGLLFCCKYKGYTYHIHPNVNLGKKTVLRPFIIAGWQGKVREPMKGDSKSQPFAGHDGGQEGSDE